MIIVLVGAAFSAQTIVFTTTSKGTRLPLDIKLSIVFPSSLPLATSALKRSPVE